MTGKMRLFAKTAPVPGTEQDQTKPANTRGLASGDIFSRMMGVTNSQLDGNSTDVLVSLEL